MMSRELDRYLQLRHEHYQHVQALCYRYASGSVEAERELADMHWPTPEATQLLALMPYDDYLLTDHGCTKTYPEGEE